MDTYLLVGLGELNRQDANCIIDNDTMNNREAL